MKRLIGLAVMSLVAVGAFAAGQQKTPPGNGTPTTTPAARQVALTCNSPYFKGAWDSTGKNLTCVPVAPQMKCQTGLEWYYNKANCTAGCRKVAH